MIALKTGQAVHDVIMGVFNPEIEEYRWLKVNAVPQYMPGQNKPYQVYTSFENITLLKRSEDELNLAKLNLEMYAKELTETLNLSESQRYEMEEAKERAEKLMIEADAANRPRPPFWPTSATNCAHL